MSDSHISLDASESFLTTEQWRIGESDLWVSQFVVHQPLSACIAELASMCVFEVEPESERNVSHILSASTVVEQYLWVSILCPSDTDDLQATYMRLLCMVQRET